MSKEAMKLALEALVCLKKDFDADQFEWGIADEAITALQKALAQQALDKMAENARELGLDYDVKSDHRLMEMPAQQEPVALETVYETIIHWDEGGGKRSRRELAQRIVALYAAHGIKENT